MPSIEITSDGGNELESSAVPRILTAREQRALLRLLQKGGSPLSACLQLDVLLDSFDLTREVDAGFRERVERSTHCLDENVAAAVYRDALQGNPSAQSNYLRMRTQQTEAAIRGSTRESELAQLSTADLLAYQTRLRQLGEVSASGDGVQ